MLLNYIRAVLLPGVSQKRATLKLSSQEGDACFLRHSVVSKRVRHITLMNLLTYWVCVCVRACVVRVLRSRPVACHLATVSHSHCLSVCLSVSVCISVLCLYQPFIWVPPPMMPSVLLSAVV